MIYLDNAATTMKKPPGVYEAMLQAAKSSANPGRAGYSESIKAADIIYNTREIVAELFGAPSPEQVVFTQNATHALNIAIKGVCNGGNCVISGYEHNSVVRPLEAMGDNGVTYSAVFGRVFDEDDFIKKFRKSIKRDTKMCVCTQVSNVFGYILPIAEIDEICREKGIPLIIDASQGAGSVELKLSSLKATVCICAPGHKGLYGPQGTGVLICKDGSSLKTLMQGGTGSVSSELSQPDFMPDRHECGTMNVPGIAGLGEGVKYVLGRGVENILKHERELIKIISEGLLELSGVRVYSSRNKNQSGVLSFVINGCSCEDIAQKLSDEGVAVRSGMHCSPIAHKCVGTKGGTLRVSVSDFTSENDAFAFIDKIRRIRGRFK